jgi:hypothetical protein
VRRKRTSRQRTSSVALWAWFLSCTGYRLMTRPHGLTVPPRLCHRVGVTVRRLRPGTGRRDLRGAADSSGGLCGSRWFRGSSQRHGRSDLVQSPFVALAGRFGRRRYPPTGIDAVIPLGLAEPQPSNLVECVEAVAPGENVEAQGSVAAAGALLVPAGTQLSPPHTGMLICAGLVSVDVVQRPRVRIAATPKNAEIDSNGPMIRGLVQRDGGAIADVIAAERMRRVNPPTALRAPRFGYGPDRSSRPVVARCHESQVRPPRPARLRLWSSVPGPVPPMTNTMSTPSASKAFRIPCEVRQIC